MAGNERTLTLSRDKSEWMADGRPASDNRMDFAAGSGKHTIVFNIGTPTGRYVFTEDPIWIMVDDGNCPASASSVPDVTIKHAGKTQLILGNANNEQAIYRYQLNIYDTANGEYACIDPILSNGGHNLQ